MTKAILAAIALAGVVLQTPPLWAQGEEDPPAPVPPPPGSADAPAATPPAPAEPPALPPPPPPTATASPPAAVPVATDHRPPPPQTAPERDEPNASPGQAQRVFGWTAVAVGGATTVAGLIIASVAAAKLADLDCCDDRCPPDQHEDAEAYNDLRLPAGLTTFAGAALIGLGLPFLIAGEAADEAALSAVLSPGGITLRGTF